MQDSIVFNRFDILNILNRWPSSSAITPDGIPFKFIKRIAAHIVSPLEFLFNLMFHRSEVPSRWKHAYVTPIQKKPPFSDPSNYRPVSITSIFCRIFEKIVKKVVVRHLDEYNVLSPHQHGFRSNRSTVTQMIETLNDWTSLLDSNTNVDVIYFDFEKAFDRVCHNKLLLKLTHVGIHPRIVSWIQAFLCGRTFQVRVNGSYSSSRAAPSGVPQGCVLSPVLFNIFSYEIGSLLAESSVGCKVFADDIKIYSGLGANSHGNLQSAIDLLVSWSKDWDLPISVAKSKVLHLGRSNPRHVYSIDGIPLQAVTKIKDLGFIIDSTLSFEDHCNSIATKADRRLFLLFKTLSTKDPKLLVKAYKVFVRSILEYGTSVYSPYKQKSILRLEKVQSSFTRKLFLRSMGFNYDDIPRSSLRNEQLGLKSLRWRRMRNDLILIYKIIHGKAEVNSDGLFKMNPSSTRGNGLKLSFPRPRSTLRRHFFACRAALEFGKLIKRVQLPGSLSKFKNIISDYVPE